MSRKCDHDWFDHYTARSYPLSIHAATVPFVTHFNTLRRF